MIILTQAQALAVLFQSLQGLGSTEYLEPVLQTDGNYAVPQSALTNPRHAHLWPTLALGTIGSPAGTAGYSEFMMKLGTQPMRLATNKQPWSFTSPNAGLYRHEVRLHDYGDLVNDPINQNRRSEMVANTQRYFSGDSAWAAWSTVLGARNGMLRTENYQFGLVHQWHSVDTTISRSPIIALDYSRNAVNLYTRSSAALTASLNGVPQTRYTAALPAVGTVMNYVLHATFGAAGTGALQFWVNGTSVYNASIPLGYYNDAPAALGYPQWGYYTQDQDTRDVVFTANPEFGTADLSGRVTSPLTVTAPAAGWV